MSQGLLSVPAGGEGLSLTSREREVFGGYLLARPGDRLYEERESLRVRGRVGLLGHIQQVATEVCGEHGVPAGRLDRINGYLTSETFLRGCFGEIDEGVAFGRNLNLEAGDLDGGEALSILLGMGSDITIAQLKSHITKWVTSVIPQMIGVVDEEVGAEVALMRDSVEEAVEEWLQEECGDPVTNFRTALEDYAREQHLYTMYGRPTRRNRSRYWTCRLTATGRSIDDTEVIGRSSTSSGSKEDAARKMLRRLTG
ncbi:hypothetical protein TWF281_002433 [Arthrobotrys megalospora]